MDTELQKRIKALTPEARQALYLELSGRLTEPRRAGMEEVLSRRTRHACVVLEDIYQPHNASAVLRSCDGFGIQDVHILERRYRFQLKKTISLGASKWLTLHRRRLGEEDASAPYLSELKANGYRVVATTLRPGSRPLEEININRPVALCFGTEEEGLSDSAHEAADELVHLPMYGFTQSFNISVTVALCLQILRMRMKQAGIEAPLTDAEKDELRLQWVLASLPHARTQVLEYLGR